MIGDGASHMASFSQSMRHCYAMLKFVYDIGSSGQSYKVSMSINYNQRVTITSKLIIFMALDRRGFISMTTFVYLKA